MKHLLFASVVLFSMLSLTDMLFLHGLLHALYTAIVAAL